MSLLLSGKKPKTTCQHNGPSSYSRKQDLKDDEIQSTFNEFHVKFKKQRQDQIIFNCMLLVPVKRRRVATSEGKRNVQYSIHYYVSIEQIT